jgi:glycosyltransferase involved in cell wall biosynthesis
MTGSPANVQPLLSVIVPVYNGGRYLAAALNSVLDQFDDSVEMIVSDDGSTDGSREILERYSNSGSVIAIDGPRSGNWVANTNRALAGSKGRYVTILHQDDLWLPGRLRAIRQSLEGLPGCGIWINPSYFIDSTGRIVGTWRLPFRQTLARIDSSDFIARLLVQNFLGMPAPVFPRATFEQTGGFDETLWYTADWDLWLKLACQAPVGVNPQPTTAFRLHSESQTALGVRAVESMRVQTELVRARHLERLMNPARRSLTNRAGRFSTELNAAVASLLGNEPVRWGELTRSLLSLGPRGAYSFLLNARFFERSMARLRIGLARELRSPEIK